MLVDKLNRPLHDLRISVTDRCNFRCGYCMPKAVFGKGYPFLKSESMLSYDQIVTLANIFARLGVEKIRLTGGEPLLRKDLEELICKLVKVSGIQDIALTTNASLLTRERVDRLLDAGLKRINISLDAITPQIYHRINEVPYPLEDILAGIDSALQSDFDSVKVNMVVQKGINDSDILNMAEYFRGTAAILRFIEFMDVGNHNNWNLDQVFSAREIVDRINDKYPLEPLDRNYSSEVAKRWKYKDGGGEIGVIASITQPFCGNCSRARLSARGELYTCLFATSGYNLKQLLDSGCDAHAIERKVGAIWSKRQDQYSMLRSINPDMPAAGSSRKVEMSYIGG